MFTANEEIQDSSPIFICTKCVVGFIYKLMVNIFFYNELCYFIMTTTDK